jgi:hypothetical protein
MICKWAKPCAYCNVRIEVGDEIYAVFNTFGEREYIDEWCAKSSGIICACGATKKREHDTCYACKIKNDKNAGLRCDCGKYKKPEHATCYTCKREQDKTEGLICGCGRYKKPQYERCFTCKQEKVNG